MNRTYYIGFKDEKLGKYLFLGQTDTLWCSDYQSARAFSKPEFKRVERQIKQQYKEKKLEILQINPKTIKKIK